MLTNIAYVALGSNLKSPLQQVTKALRALADLPRTELKARSSWYRSRAVGPGEQSDYINGVAKLETGLSAIDLLDELQSIENRQGRVRQQRWGARTLDLDILLYGDEHIDQPRLKVPHPEMLKRNFVVVPLAELDPDLRLAHHVEKEEIVVLSAREHCERLGRDGLVKLDGDSIE